MSTCVSCGTQLKNDGRFCSSCGAPVGANPANGDELATLDFASPPTPPARASSSSGASSSSDYSQGEGRFLPGRLLAGRYRIIALLGKGGMGEVYRADDLTLGQPVALKFLPDDAARDQGLLERFRNEVRIARRVSHPNVCRVYDVGEVDGHRFFTMEYVDGEDLASLLRRIGRLPQDKALDIARQLCAGLLAAHAKGVLHRDLKPANIMLDGRGQVVITDFGLAGLAGQIQGAEVRCGTPAYMAPEQLAGKEVTARSDIYGLGLVLYEIFTGKRALSDKSAAALRSREDRTPSRPSSVVRDLDPIVERVILRCLEKEPSARPATVMSVAAALPGGDPLAAALAAGETPSPQLVAASGENAGLRPRIAVLCMAAVLVGLGLAVCLTIRHSALEKIKLQQSPEVLAQKAREIMGRLGYEGRQLDSAYGLYNNDDFVEYVEKNDKPRPQWSEILAARPSLLTYWYRQSPQYMIANEFHDILLNPGIVSQEDPPPVLSAMINLEIDPEGRLLYFQAMPPQREEPGGKPAPPEWSWLFASADLDQSKFQPVQPLWNSLAAGDTRAAWTGMWPGTNRPLRVEAASWRGKPVFFSLIGEWTKPQRMKTQEKSTGNKISQMIGILLLISTLMGAAFLARRNYRQGRGDRDGAFRLATIMFGLEILLWLCRGHLPPSFDTFGLFILAISGGLFVAGMTWLLYLALEPWVRRRWPQTLISWSRLLSGKVSDPLVGRDLLFGVLLGAVWILVFQIRYVVMIHMGAAPFLFADDYLLGGRQALGTWLFQIPTSILGALQFFFLLLGLKVLLRKDWLAAVVFVTFFTVVKTLGSSYAKVEIPAHIIVYAIAVLIVYRFGLVSLAVAIFTIDMLANVPFTADFSAWYASTSILALLSVVALAFWGFYHSLGSEALWRPEVQ